MNTIQTLTVYLGSSGHARPVFGQSAAALGRLIAESKKNLIYGGMDAGLMGVLAASALKAGGHVTGIIPRNLKDSERILGGLTETILVEELSDRKKKMFLMADAIIALPGGFGTLDESLEVLYWGAKKLHAKPLVLVNIEKYWDDIIPYLQNLPDFDPAYLIIVQTLEDIFPALERWAAPTIPATTQSHFPHFEDEIMRKTQEPIIIDIASLENTYFAVCAMGLKQLHKTQRAIGLLNTNGQFNGLIDWLNRAAAETFITPSCLKLFDVAMEKDALQEMLTHQEYIKIDLHHTKWGAPEPI
ncbi:MAG: TIGR00730 family Rossman fold protein [Alphaproteobacteria bacterium]|nr:TIGR00730 family Rossman fold protein [Alphaproteobacteria bacterium]